MKLTYYGHSCFSIESGGFTVVVDPYKDVEGREDVHLMANAVYCSHQHFDHNYVAGVNLIGGENPFTVTEIHSFHDEARGAKRGENIIRIFEAEGVRIAHFGDLGCSLEPDQLRALSGLDVALIPVGGTYTIGPKEAKALIETIKPVTAIPMHYKNGSEGFSNIRALSEFTNLFATVSETKGTLEISQKPAGILVMIS